MLKYRYLYTIILLLLLVTSVPVLAQNTDWESTGEIEDVQVEIVKDREIILPRANRNYDKVPPLPVEDITKDIKYEFRNFSFEVPELDFKLRPLRLRAEPMPKLYNGYVKAGFGNYVTPYFEGYINNKRDKQYSYGAHVKHLSSRNGPIDDDNSGTPESIVDVFANAYGRKATIGGSFAYSGNSYNYYGYPSGIPVDKDTINHDFNKIALKTSLKSSNSSNPFQYDAQFNFDNITDNLSAKESEIGVVASGRYSITDESSAGIGMNVSIANQSDEAFTSHSRILFSVLPEYRFVYNSIDVRAGANITYSDDTLGGMASFRIYPMVEASYEITPNTNLYGGLSGSTQRNTYRELAKENPYLGPNSIAFDSNKQLDIHGGLKSNITSNFTSEVGFSYNLYKNMYFFNNGIDQSMFNVLYDLGNTTVTSLFVKASYESKDAFNIGIMAKLNQYGTDKLPEPWHKPQYQITVNAQYNIFDKILLGSDLFVLGGIKAQDNITASTITLDPVVDLNINAEYRLSDRFSAFVQLKNLLGGEYEYYHNYPTKAFQALGGISYSF